MLIQLLVLILPLAACVADFPYASGTNVFNGLALHVWADHSLYFLNEKPVITVVFSNQSDKSVNLLNHFAYCAEGPLLTVSRHVAPDGTCPEIEFEKQIFLPRQTNHWITIDPSATFQFQSSIYKPLTNSGVHRFQVSYRVEGPAFRAIKQCQENEGAPKDFWQGILVSKEIRIEVATTTGTRIILPAASSQPFTPNVTNMQSARLGLPFGTVMTIEGIRKDGLKLGTRTIIVDTINGSKLEKPVVIWVDGIPYPGLPSAQRCILKGFETCHWIGGPYQQIPRQLFWAFTVTEIIEPATLKIGIKPDQILSNNCNTVSQH